MPNAPQVTTILRCSNPVLENHHLLRCRPNSQSLEILHLINSGALSPSADLYNALINQSRRSLNAAQQLRDHLLQSPIPNSNFIPPTSILNSLLNLFCKCSSLNHARKLFDEMPEKDMVTFTTIISGYSQNNQPRNALVLFPDMLRLGLVPNGFSFASLFKACGAAKNGVSSGMQIHALAIKFGCSSDVFVGSSVLDMYAKGGKMQDARLAFDQLGEKRNEVFCVISL